MAAARRNHDEQPHEAVCPIRAEFPTLELTAEHARVLRILSEVAGVSYDTYLRIFSHGANYARLTA